MNGDKYLNIRTVPALLLFLACGCATIVADNLPAAMDLATDRGRYDLECQNVQAEVLSEKLVEGEPADSSQHTIKVTGCGRQAIYVAHCAAKNDCTIKMNPGQDLTFPQKEIPY